MRLLIVCCSFSVLVGAALLELISIFRGVSASVIASCLMALGAGGLSIRLGYLVAMEDLDRLSIWGTLPIFCMAMARVIACGTLIRKSL